MPVSWNKSFLRKETKHQLRNNNPGLQKMTTHTIRFGRAMLKHAYSLRPVYTQTHTTGHWGVKPTTGVSFFFFLPFFFFFVQERERLTEYIVVEKR